MMGTSEHVFQEVVSEEQSQTIARMYLQGYTQFVIGKLMQLSQRTVSRRLDEVRREWLEARINTYEERVEREVRGLDMQESALWEAWYKSCEQEVVRTVAQKKRRPLPKKARTSKEQDDDSGCSDVCQESSDELQIVEENSKTVTRSLYGDPRFMAEITKVRELRCKLLGLLEDEPIAPAVVNIWQQLQDTAFNRERDEIEDKLKMIVERPVVQSTDARFDHPVVEKPVENKRTVVDPFESPLLEGIKGRRLDDGDREDEDGQSVLDETQNGCTDNNQQSVSSPDENEDANESSSLISNNTPPSQSSSDKSKQPPPVNSNPTTHQRSTSPPSQPADANLTDDDLINRRLKKGRHNDNRHIEIDEE